MAKLNGKGVVLAGVVAGVLSFLRKKDNRDKTMNYLAQLKKEANSSLKESIDIQQKMDEYSHATQAEKDTKETGSIKDEKIAGFMAMSPDAKEKPQKETLEDVAATAAQAVDSVLEGNHMIDEGAQTTVNHFNEERQSQQDSR